MKKIILGSILVSMLIITGCGYPTPEKVLTKESQLRAKAQQAYNNGQYDLAMKYVDERMDYMRFKPYDLCDYDFGTIKWKQCHKYWKDVDDRINPIYFKIKEAIERESKKPYKP